MQTGDRRTDKRPASILDFLAPLETNVSHP
jgi:hypothetical protein